MKPGDNVRMIVFPTQDYASKFCTENVLYLGCVCKYVGSGKRLGFCL